MEEEQGGDKNRGNESERKTTIGELVAKVCDGINTTSS
jgi:hypothetical protein